jgi:hypothetical protein
MEVDNRAVFAEWWQVLLRLYGDVERVELLPLYWRLLKGYSWHEIQQATWQHIHDPKRGQFFPKPMELMSGIVRERSRKAWCHVQEAMTAVGAYESVVFHDPVIYHVITALGGWVTLCRTPQVMLDSVRRRFEEYYQQMPRRLHETPRVLHGLLPQNPPLFCGQDEQGGMIVEVWNEINRVA